ncbi:MAG: hypothetical protein ACI9MU_004047 [Alphaproteobacteria bacterium]|jgi:hypothetical protein
MKTLLLTVGLAAAVMVPCTAHADFSTTRVLLTTTMKALLNDGWAIRSFSGPRKRNNFVLERNGKWVYCESNAVIGRNGKHSHTRNGYSYSDRCFKMN